jgi:toxin ParE1/3/4
MLRILDAAHNDASEAAQWYGRHQPGLRSDFLAELSGAYQAIEEAPLRHPRVEHPGMSEHVRRVLLLRFPFLVIYEVLDDEPLVLAVAHASRDTEFWIGRLADH